MIPKKEFSRRDFTELSAFFRSDSTPEECLNISQLHGYLTSLAIGPKTIMPSRWLVDIWGNEMIWDSLEATENIIGLIMTLYNSLIEAVSKPLGKFRLLLNDASGEDPGRALLEDWCTGFMLGVSLASNDWKPLIHSKTDQELLGVIILFGTDSGKQKLKGIPDFTDQDIKKYADVIRLSVKLISNYWLPYRKDVLQSTHQAISNKVGRNDPCPCGSGKKFKNCCMN